MTTLNSYATILEYKAYKTARGQTSSTDALDDVVIESLLKSASRYIDSKTGRHFSPYIETRYFSVPDNQTLVMDDDLLEVISITNGDATSVPSTEYVLRPRNLSPRYAIRLIDTSTYSWLGSSAGNTNDVIQVNGVWGYHDHYSQAWTLATTAAEAMDATETGYDVTSGLSFTAGNIARFDNELGYVSSVSTNTLTITRGENNSTAATHLTSINVYTWQVMDEVRQVVYEIVNNAYGRRFGESRDSTSTITGAGVVLSPRDIPTMAAEFINTYRRIV